VVRGNTHGAIAGTAQAAAEVPSARLRAAEAAENFPVALRVLPARHRSRLQTVYGVVRTIDDLGDEGPAGPAERVAALEAFRADLHSPTPRSPVLAALARDVPDLPTEPFDRLIAANLQDQHVTSYPTWEALRGYCALSADPIGRIVLAVFEVDADAATLRASDAVCTALQVLEHCQDVREDRARGRVYLPVEDLDAFGVSADELDLPVATDRLRALVRHETDRAERLLDEGAVVVGAGRAAVDALRRVDGDVLGRSGEAAHSRRRDVLRHLPRTLRSRR
jgi:squalene synthase HpnC